MNRFVSPSWASSVRGTGYGFKVRRDNQIAGVGGAGSGVQCGLDSRMHVPWMGFESEVGDGGKRVSLGF